MEWKMWAQNRNGVFFHVGEKWWVDLHGKEEPIVPVIVKGDKKGTYYGWVETGKRKPTMIWPSLAQFSMCFPYGYKAEEKAGHGYRVQLKILLIK